MIAQLLCLPLPDLDLSGWSVNWCSVGRGAQLIAAAFVVYHYACVQMYLYSTYTVKYNQGLD